MKKVKKLMKKKLEIIFKKCVLPLNNIGNLYFIQDYYFKAL